MHFKHINISEGGRFGQIFGGGEQCKNVKSSTCPFSLLKVMIHGQYSDIQYSVSSDKDGTCTVLYILIFLNTYAL